MWRSDWTVFSFERNEHLSLIMLLIRSSEAKIKQGEEVIYWKQNWGFGWRKRRRQQQLSKNPHRGPEVYTAPRSPSPDSAKKLYRVCLSSSLPWQKYSHIDESQPLKEARLRMSTMLNIRAKGHCTFWLIGNCLNSGTQYRGKVDPFAIWGPYSQRYGIPSSHVKM